MITSNPAMPAHPPTVETVASAHDANLGGDIFGGWLMAQMDLAGGARAYAHAGNRVVTAGVTDLSFRAAIFPGDRLRFYTDILRIGRTSISISLQVWRVSATKPGFDLVARGVYTFVAVDDQNRPTPISHSPETMAA